MKLTEIQLLFAYHTWANGKILNTLEEADWHVVTAPPAAGGPTLHTTLVHMLDAEYAWRMLLQNQTRITSIEPHELPTLPSLRARWRQEIAAWDAYLADLTDADLAAPITYTTYTGELRSRQLWHGLVHVINHGTQHRSEAAWVLTSLNHSPGELDFTIFLAARDRVEPPGTDDGPA